MVLKVRDTRTGEVFFTNGEVSDIGTVLCTKEDGTAAGSYPIEELDYFIEKNNMFMRFEDAISNNCLRDEYTNRVLKLSQPSSKQLAQIIKSLSTTCVKSAM